jgi:hypothetical protein
MIDDIPQLKDSNWTPTTKKGAWKYIKKPNETYPETVQWKTDNNGKKYISWQTFPTLPKEMRAKELKKCSEAGIKAGRQYNHPNKVWRIAIDFDDQQMGETKKKALFDLEQFYNFVGSSFTRKTKNGGYHLYYDIMAFISDLAHIDFRRYLEHPQYGPLQIEIKNKSFIKEIGPGRENLDNVDILEVVNINEYLNDLIDFYIQHGYRQIGHKELKFPFYSKAEPHKSNSVNKTTQKQIIHKSTKDLKLIFENVITESGIGGEYNSYKNNGLRNDKCLSINGTLANIGFTDKQRSIFGDVFHRLVESKNPRGKQKRTCFHEPIPNKHKGIPRFKEEFEQSGDSFIECIKNKFPYLYEMNELDYKVYINTQKGELGNYKIPQGENKAHIYNPELFAAPLDITILTDPLENEQMIYYIMRLKDGTIKSFCGVDHENILKNNKLTLLTATNSNTVSNTLNKVLMNLKEKGIVNEEIKPSKTGIFYFNDKLIFNDIKIPETTDKTKLSKTLEILELLVETYGYNMSKELAKYYLFLIAAPFDYLAKQLRKQHNYKFTHSFWLQRPVFDGIGHDGKTYHAMLGKRMYGDFVLDKNGYWDIGDGSFDNPARIGEALSHMTFPIVIEEVNTLFDPKKTHLQEIYKRSIDSTNTRSWISSGNDKMLRKQVFMHSLSPVIITTNNSNMNLKDALKRRINHLHFDTEYNQHVRDNRESFLRNIDPYIECLSELGGFVLRTVHEKGIDLILNSKHGLDFGYMILKMAYDLVGYDMPDIWEVQFEDNVDLDNVYGTHADEVIMILREKIHIPPNLSDDFDQRFETIREIFGDAFRHHRTNTSRVILTEADFKKLPSTVPKNLDHIKRLLERSGDDCRGKIEIKKVKHGRTDGLSVAIVDLMDIMGYSHYLTYCGANKKISTTTKEIAV